jgi:cytochrome c peroxidase
MLQTAKWICAFLISSFFCELTAVGQALPNLFPFPNRFGLLKTYSTQGDTIDLSGPFFRSLGGNGRSCSSCHQPAQGWSVSPDELKLRFLITEGLDPIFRTNDGSVCDHGVDTSTVGTRSSAYRLLLNKGLIRVSMPVPENAEFEVINLANPYGCNEMDKISVYRRPLPSTNLRFLSAVMWDGRESSIQTGTQPITYNTNPDDLRADLAHQAMDAALGHAQAPIAPTQEQLQAIVNFEMAMATAQAFDFHAGPLDTHGATGGPVTLGKQTIPAFYIGINDPLGGNPRGAPFNPNVFKLFDAWMNSPQYPEEHAAAQLVRASIARGQALFNSRPISINGVAGLNDELHVASITGTCGTCHDAPNAGDHSIAVALNIGVADPDSALDLSYLPLITFENKVTHEIKVTTDPGRALITGLWKDIGKVKGPVLRGLAARAPYFHNGSAATLGDVIDFYNKRFDIGLSQQEKEDLIAFLNAL